LNIFSQSHENDSASWSQIFSDVQALFLIDVDFFVDLILARLQRGHFVPT